MLLRQPEMVLNWRPILYLSVRLCRRVQFWILIAIASGSLFGSWGALEIIVRAYSSIPVVIAYPPLASEE